MGLLLLRLKLGLGLLLLGLLLLGLLLVLDRKIIESTLRQKLRIHKVTLVYARPNW